MTIEEDIKSFVSTHPGCESKDVIQHLSEIRGTVNQANVTTLLREMADKNKLKRTQVCGAHGLRFLYSIPKKEAGN